MIVDVLVLLWVGLVLGLLTWALGKILTPAVKRWYTNARVLYWSWRLVRKRQRHEDILGTGAEVSGTITWSSGRQTTIGRDR